MQKARKEVLMRGGKRAQRARFRRAAKACKGKPGFKACMSRHLRK